MSGKNNKSYSISNTNSIKEELSNDTISLCVSIFTFLVLCYFFFSYIINLLEIIKNYINKSLIVNQTNKKLAKDNNQFDRDNIFYDSNRNEILKSIKNISNNYSDEFKKLKNYKEKTNKEYSDAEKDIRLDTNLYSEVNAKVLSNKYDNYKYDNSPSIFQFIIDIFKPTTA
jgi:hypothetical protein